MALPTTYALTRLAIGAQSHIEISGDEFTALKNARRGMIAVMFIEEKFDLLIENCVELERTLLDIALQLSFYRNRSWFSMIADMQTINRRLVNLLSTARLYIDQAKHDISQLSGAERLARLKQQLSAQYDAVLGYRVMEALRNHTQHYGLPIESIRYPHNIESEPRSR
jgi:hypothetical protein